MNLRIEIFQDHTNLYVDEKKVETKIETAFVPFINGIGRMTKCVICGTEFVAKTRGRAKYCSPKCKKQGIRYHQRVWLRRKIRNQKKNVLSGFEPKGMPELLRPRV